MKLTAEHVALSATDLANFLACRRKTALGQEVGRGLRQKPENADPLLEVLRTRGQEHERRYIERERAAGHEIANLSAPEGQPRDRAALVAATLAAMRRGVPRIVQAALQSGDGRWFGYADVLRRVETAGRLGPNGGQSAWSYEALDTKLALETKGATMLQLALYSEVLAEVQGVTPEYFHVVTPGALDDRDNRPEPFSEERYRVSDYAAYCRLIKRGLIGAVDSWDRDAPLPYPEPVAHCDICDWAGQCRAQLRVDDHLSFVAGSSGLQRTELAAHGITTLQVLGADGLPRPFKPSRGSAATYERLQHQARLQLQARDAGGTPPFDQLPIQKDPALGLCLLPEPSSGDVFLDLEGATFARDGGREYLFGLVSEGADGSPDYESFQAFDDVSEQRAFEAVMDRIIAKFESHPEMHVYHYAPYEPSAFKKLMGRYATRGPELDRLLRAERFVDLYGIVRHAIRAGVESYSIKSLEPLYAFERAVSLDKAGLGRRLVENALNLGSPDLVNPADLEVVRAYNRDDCVSALRLRDWLEQLRADRVATGDQIPRRTPKPDEPDKAKALEIRARELRLKLLEGLPADRTTWSNSEYARWLLAYTVDWHTREFKAAWWEYFRLRDLPAEDQIDEPKVVVGLEFLERVDVKKGKNGKPTGTVTDRYRYADDQEMEIDDDAGLKLADETKWGTVVAVDRIARTMDVSKGPKIAELHASSAFAFFSVGTEIIQKSVLEFADGVVMSGMDAAAPDCRRNLFLRRPPPALTAQSALETSTVLAIQGPPGTGKTYTGAEMICDLVRDGKRVGVLANSHKVIRNLLKGVVKEAAKRAQLVRVMHRVKEEMNDGPDILEIEGLDDALAQLAAGAVQVLGAVAWTWASDKAIDIIDVLVVDEAGQMSLANVLGSARAAKALVLLGDQQQLDQPSKASHPDGVSISALEHILDGERTMPRDRGLFLPMTRRLAPPIAKFTSEVFYEGRLQTLAGLEHQKLTGLAPFDTGALWVYPVKHDGHQSYSPEEVDAVTALVEQLLSPASQWIDRDQKTHRLTASDILVVAPYNAQVSRLRRSLDQRGADLQHVRVGTVDKFQGQEAPVVIYSMASSSAADAPRGMEFLFNLNRLNVATSRAQCAVIIVASPALFEPVCVTPRQIQLANALCRYRELATVVS